VARQGETCGALIGVILALGSLVGRERLEDKAQAQKAVEPAVQAVALFRERVGASLCADIHRIRHGKVYRLYLPEERKAFHEEGGHGPEGCPVVCGIAARIGAELLLNLKEERERE
jgi:hypothetical protein